MRKIFTCIVCLLAVSLCLSSCKKDEEKVQHQVVDSQQPAEPITYPAGGQLVEVLDSAAMTLDEFATQVSSSPLMQYSEATMGEKSSLMKTGIQTLINARRPVMDAMFAKQLGCGQMSKWQIESYVFSYTSTTPNGEPIVLSARVTFPNNIVPATKHFLDSYTLSFHQFVYSTSWVPSNGFTLMSMRSLYNSAVIEPDEQGQGIDNGVHSACHMSMDIRARQMSDCVMAAIEVMKRHSVALSDEGYSTNWGSSLAAPAAFAFAHYYDVNATQAERDAIRLKSTFAAHGPYDYSGLMSYMDAHSELLGVVTLGMFGIGALNSQQMYGYSASDFVADWMNNTTVTSGGKDYSFLNAAAYMLDEYLDVYFKKMAECQNLSAILAKDMMLDSVHLDFNSEKTKAFLKILYEQSNIDTWQPTTDVYMSHGEEDEVTPYSFVYDLYNKYVSAGGSARQKIHWLKAKPYTNMLDGVESMASTKVHLTLSIEAMVWMVLAPEPKDMAMFYN